jgi:hypothetical protein
VAEGFQVIANDFRKRKNFCLVAAFMVFSEIFFGSLKFGLLHLRQFFQNNLSRKAEGYGPMKPWQPYRISHPVEGANSILHSSASGWAERDKSEIKFDF